MKRITTYLILSLSTVVCSLHAAEEPSFTPRQWWLVGPYACYSAADFEANEAIENAPNAKEKGNKWNRVIGMGGRELRTLVVEGSSSGMLDLQTALGSVPAKTCAYAGLRVRAEKAGEVTATLTATEPVRWFLNNKLVGEGREAGVQKLKLNLTAGVNCLLAKTWHTGGEWRVGCALEGMALTSVDAEKGLSPARKTGGRRNVAWWSEGSKVAVSSVSVRRGFPLDMHGLSALNDGQRITNWTSLEVDLLPQWVWVRFPGMRKIDEVAVHAATVARRPLELTGEYTDDGGVTFKPLFRASDSQELSIRAKFNPVVTDNVRIRIDRVAIPAEAGFAQAHLSEIEVFGEDAPGNGSLAMEAGEPKEIPSTRLEPDNNYKPTLQQVDDATVVATPWYRVALDPHRPRIAQFQVDSLGKGEFNIKLLRRSGATALLAPLFDQPGFVQDGELKFEGNVARYPAVTVAPGVKLQMALRFHEKSFDLELTTLSARNVPLGGGVFRFDLDFWQTPTTFFGRATDRANRISLPCYMHAPDAGTLYVTQRGDAATFRQCSLEDDFDLNARQFINIAPRNEVLPRGAWQSTLTFSVTSPRPFPEITAQEPRLDGMARYALNTAQWKPSVRTLGNHQLGTTCACCVQIYGEMAAYAPMLSDEISTMGLLEPTLDNYMNGLSSHQYRHEMKVEVTPPGKWWASLESLGAMINAAWHAVHTYGGRPLLDRWLPRLEAVAGHLEAHDTDGDGIADSSDQGTWFDAYNMYFPKGLKDAYSTAVSYDAYRHLAALEDLCGRTAQAAHCRSRAQLIKDNYVKVFFNPETGVIGGWIDPAGKMHDRMFLWVNGYAINVGLVDDKMAKDILTRFLAKMKAMGFTQYHYGLITNLLPTQKDDFRQGASAWQGYMNGSITPPFSHYFMMALYRHGFRDEAEQMLWAQVRSFDKGTFNAGVAVPYQPRRNPVGSAFYKWDGSSSVGIGFLPDNYHACATLFAGHYGIRFDEHGYSLEPWSPLKGQRIRCGLPVMGKIQETME